MSSMALVDYEAYAKGDNGGPGEQRCRGWEGLRACSLMRSASIHVALSLGIEHPTIVREMMSLVSKMIVRCVI